MKIEFLTKEDIIGLKNSLEKVNQTLHSISPLAMGDLLSDSDLAKLLQVSNRTIKNWRAQGKLDYIKVGSVILTPKDAVKKFIENHRCNKNDKS